MNTAAVDRPGLIREAADEFGSQAIVVAIDARRKEVACGDMTWEVWVKGGRVPTDLDAVRWARMACEMGAGEILLTSMDRDGTTDGYDVELTKAGAAAVPVPVIASGGAGEPGHLADAVDPEKGDAEAALAASVFHFGTFSVGDAKRAIEARGLPVRMPRP
jgi:cyclase